MPQHLALTFCLGFVLCLTIIEHVPPALQQVLPALVSLCVLLAIAEAVTAIRRRRKLLFAVIIDKYTAMHDE